MSRSFSDLFLTRARFCAAALAFLLTLPAGVFGHPELMLQIELLDQQLQQHPGDGALLMKRADLYRRHGDYAAAERDLQAASRTIAVPAELPFYQGQLLLETGQPAAAEKAFSRFLVDHPHQTRALILRAEARLALNRAEQAADDYSLAIQIAESPSPELYRLNALALVSAGAHQWPAARAVVDAGLARFRSEVSLLGLGTDIALALDDPDGAETYLNRVSGAVQSLPRWEDRSELIAVLRDTDPAGRETGLQRARTRLLVQVSDQAVNGLLAGSATVT